MGPADGHEAERYGEVEDGRERGAHYSFPRPARWHRPLRWPLHLRCRGRPPPLTGGEGAARVQKGDGRENIGQHGRHAGRIGGHVRQKLGRPHSQRRGQARAARPHGREVLRRGAPRRGGRPTPNSRARPARRRRTGSRGKGVGRGRRRGNGGGAPSTGSWERSFSRGRSSRPGYPAAQEQGGATDTARTASRADCTSIGAAVETACGGLVGERAASPTARRHGGYPRALLRKVFLF